MTDLDGVLSGLEAALDRCEQIKMRVEEYGSRLASVAEVAALLDPVEDNLNVAAEQLAHASGQLQQGIEAVVATMASIIDVDLIGSFEELVGERAEHVESELGDIRDRIEARWESLMDTLEAQREEAFKALEELLDKIIPGELGDHAERLESALEALQNSGLREIQRLGEGVGQLTDKTAGLTSVVETIRPVLGLVRELL